jgi:hypothetical protein
MSKEVLIDLISFGISNPSLFSMVSYEDELGSLNRVLTETEEELSSYFSCYLVATAMEVLLGCKNPKDYLVDYGLDELMSEIDRYPYCLSLHHGSHESTIIGLSPNDIFYFDYYLEMKRKGSNFVFYHFDESTLMKLLNGLYMIDKKIYRKLLRGKYVDSSELVSITAFDIDYPVEQSLLDRMEVIRARRVRRAWKMTEVELQNVPSKNLGIATRRITRNDGYEAGRRYLVNLFRKKTRLIIDKFRDNDYSIIRPKELTL